MKRREFLKLSSATGLVTLITPAGIVQAFMPSPVTSMQKSFINPPLSSGPYTLWFWMNGQVTKQGITLDLEAMQRVGIGGVFNFDAGTGIPKGSIQYLSPEWFDVKRHALKEAERLGMAFTMHNCPGWSSSGGPWITPELSMKQLTWSETYVTGGKQISINLTAPEKKLDYYRELVVLAYPTLNGETSPQPPAKNKNLFTDWEKRGNYAFNGRGLKDISSTGNDIIDPDKIIDVTQYMNKDGSLNWQAPEGMWTVLRIGFTSIGTLNRSAPDSGIGLECDKYDKAAIKFHFDKMMSSLLPVLGPLAKEGRMGLEIDSWEIGMQNWTAGFEKEFQQRNGYDLVKYLPAMTGRLVGDVDTTERFLWDLRRTQADLLADNYYGTFHELCRQHKIIAYVEPYDRGPMEEMQIGGRADGVMGEYWNGLSSIFQNNYTMRRTIKLASSIAHTNAQKIVGVEGLTAEPQSAKWQEYAFAMKPICDKIFTNGINRIIIHRYAHQPHPTAVPGMTMGAWGIQFDRTNTLWEPNKAWLTYLGRCQDILRQGLFAADLAYFTGEDAGVYTKVNRDELNPVSPAGYDYDVINAETILRKAKIINNRLVLSDGMSYGILVLQQYKTVSLELLKKVYEFINQGVIVIGARPVSAPGLKTHSAESTAEFNTICNELWGNDNAVGITEKQLGKGRLFWGMPLTEIFKAINLKPDFESSSLSGDAPVKYFHRTADDAEIYFITNQRRNEEQVVCTFRVKGKMPQLWDAKNGTIIPAPVFEIVDGRTNVTVTLEPYGSLFVVFKNSLNGDHLKTVMKDNTTVFTSTLFPPVKREVFPDVINNFTISFWAKPEMDVMLSPAFFLEGVKGSWTDYYAVYPSSGKNLYGEGHAVTGITVGRNGVGLWEHGNDWPVFVAGAKVDISGWAHIAVVYKEGIQSVYVNAIFIDRATNVHQYLHPATGQAFIEEGASYYNGDMTKPVLHKDSLPEDKIKQLASANLPAAAAWSRIAEPAGNGKPSLLLWQNGKYTFSYASGKTTSAEIRGIEKSVMLSGAWTVSFPPKMGAPAKIILDKLMPLQKHSDEGVKYFSGTAVYSKNFIVKANEIKKGKRLFIDLGRVEVMAEILVNGKSAGILWSRPYVADITDLVKAGTNLLEVRVTNQWVNRLIGDEQKPAVDKYSNEGAGTPFAALSVGAIELLPEWYTKGESKPDNGRVTFTTWKHYQKNSPLLESGLIGPVVLRTAMVKEL